MRAAWITCRKSCAFPLIALAAIQAFASALVGQSHAVGADEVLNLRSAILAEDRRVFIAKPADYNGAAEQYPVLYLLDAETHFRYASGIVEFLAFDRPAPGPPQCWRMSTGREYAPAWD
jgi:hypothetical protein